MHRMWFTLLSELCRDELDESSKSSYFTPMIAFLLFIKCLRVVFMRRWEQ